MTAPIVVAGGGLAGAAAACLLARAGRRVLVFEREAAPAEQICGEFISFEAQSYLARLGVDPAALGAHRIARLRLVRGARVVEADLPFAASGLSRRVLDAALLTQAEAAGATIRRGHAVTRARPGDNPTLAVAGLGEISAAALFLATGKHDLRGLRRQPATAPEDLIGFKTHLRLAPAQHAALAGHVEVIMLPDGYAGLQPVEAGISNLCLLVARRRLQRAGGDWAGLLRDLRAAEPHLLTRLEGATPLDPRPLSICRVPYGFVHAPSAADAPGVFRLGDQMGVIASFSGDGMSIALHSAAVAAGAYLGGQPSFAYHRQMRRDIAGQIGRASALYRIGRLACGPAMLMRLAAMWPRGLALAATLTRIAPRALEREARRLVLAALLLCAVPAAAWAQPTPEGLWRTFDDHTGRERGLVRIERERGELIGRIVGTTDPAEAAHTCDLCRGDRKGKPIAGLLIINGMRQDGDAWDGGQILDPQTGSVYRCTMRLADGGRMLIVRGFVGLSLLGRSQTWLRAQ